MPNKILLFLLVFVIQYLNSQQKMKEIICTDAIIYLNGILKDSQKVNNSRIDENWAYNIPNNIISEIKSLRDKMTRFKDSSEINDYMVEKEFTFDLDNINQQISLFKPNMGQLKNIFIMKNYAFDDSKLKQEINQNMTYNLRIGSITRNCPYNGPWMYIAYPSNEFSKLTLNWFFRYETFKNKYKDQIEFKLRLIGFSEDEIRSILFEAYKSNNTIFYYMNNVYSFVYMELYEIIIK